MEDITYDVQSRAFRTLAVRDMMARAVELIGANGIRNPIAFLFSALRKRKLIKSPELPSGFSESLAGTDFHSFVKVYRRIEYLKFGKRLETMDAGFFAHAVNFDPDRSVLQSLYSDYKSYVRFAKGLSFEKAMGMDDLAMQNEQIGVRSCFSIGGENRGSVLLVFASGMASMFFVVSKGRRIGKLWVYGNEGGLAIPNIYMETPHRFAHVLFARANETLGGDVETVASKLSESGLFRACPFYHDLMRSTGPDRTGKRK